ncbi:hypothetical protein CERSUDRAFT_98653 [Gelatoporia subvermispora B]|uniref:F-box domain-containing protein n=1 Tax=Ceriporiopsis subvermispora (strain B) TaxID=914234 RepID=M2QLM2_CERS8|nr:hypothetical protein CERSUDRAFT_98653 [Gelatoporia subvermispora B]
MKESAETMITISNESENSGGWRTHLYYSKDTIEEANRLLKESGILSSESSPSQERSRPATSTSSAQQPLRHSPSDLAVEIWWDILDQIDDIRSLLVLERTCKGLAELVVKIRDGHAGTLDRAIQVKALREEIEVDPILPFLLLDVHVVDFEVAKFAYELAGKLHGLRRIQISASTQSKLRAVPRLNWAVFTQWSHFSRVVEIRLIAPRFDSYADLSRIVCALPDLRTLCLVLVNWRKGEARSLAEEPFARLLRLEHAMVMQAQEYQNLAVLLTAPALRRLDLAADPALLDGLPVVPPSALPRLLVKVSAEEQHLTYACRHRHPLSTAAG